MPFYGAIHGISGEAAGPMTAFEQAYLPFSGAHQTLQSLPPRNLPSEAHKSEVKVTQSHPSPRPRSSSVLADHQAKLRMGPCFALRAPTSTASATTPYYAMHHGSGASKPAFTTSVTDLQMAVPQSAIQPRPAYPKVPQRSSSYQLTQQNKSRYDWLQETERHGTAFAHADDPINRRPSASEYCCIQRPSPPSLKREHSSESSSSDSTAGTTPYETNTFGLNSACVSPTSTVMTSPCTSKPTSPRYRATSTVACNGSVLGNADDSFILTSHASLRHVSQLVPARSVATGFGNSALGLSMGVPVIPNPSAQQQLPAKCSGPAFDVDVPSTPPTDRFDPLPPRSGSASPVNPPAYLAQSPLVAVSQPVASSPSSSAAIIAVSAIGSDVTTCVINEQQPASVPLARHPRSQSSVEVCHLPARAIAARNTAVVTVAPLGRSDIAVSTADIALPDLGYSKVSQLPVQESGLRARRLGKGHPILSLRSEAPQEAEASASSMHHAPLSFSESSLLETGNSTDNGSPNEAKMNMDTVCDSHARQNCQEPSNHLRSSYFAKLSALDDCRDDQSDGTVTPNRYAASSPAQEKVHKDEDEVPAAVKAAHSRFAKALRATVQPQTHMELAIRRSLAPTPPLGSPSILVDHVPSQPSKPQLLGQARWVEHNASELSKTERASPFELGSSLIAQRTDSSHACAAPLSPLPPAHVAVRLQMERDLEEQKRSSSDDGDASRRRYTVSGVYNSGPSIASDRFMHSLSSRGPLSSRDILQAAERDRMDSGAHQARTLSRPASWGPDKADDSAKVNEHTCPALGPASNGKVPARPAKSKLRLIAATPGAIPSVVTMARDKSTSSQIPPSLRGVFATVLGRARDTEPGSTAPPSTPATPAPRLVAPKAISPARAAFINKLTEVAVMPTSSNIQEDVLREDLESQSLVVALEHFVPDPENLPNFPTSIKMATGSSSSNSGSSYLPPCKTTGSRRSSIRSRIPSMDEDAPDHETHRPPRMYSMPSTSQPRQIEEHRLTPRPIEPAAVVTASGALVRPVLIPAPKRT
ncbi:hypothetical protein IE81DRAFT_83892 [Ceraceosorus guamensis]|uniref:Uncharacterized protein n=1 Tax=Ceraceosorus guamensis TaxID=1522189 RepID=A0A316WEC9_9BASI|nr:hypothetical protein IE81DRAFT_83892 [Ceraceosorus guamensis]PWN46123.1 hypothetical protein IE81DRAFT_83892 [Ceraceosorus guamensis]